MIIAGDFNDTPGSAPLKPLLNNSGLFDTLAVANVSADQRWTYYFGNYILVYPKFKLFDKVYNSLSNADKIIVESPDWVRCFLGETSSEDALHGRQARESESTRSQECSE